LKESDIVTIHIPLNADTRGSIGEREFALMKPGALLINTARGPICDTAALLAGLAATPAARADNTRVSISDFAWSNPRVGIDLNEKAAAKFPVRDDPSFDMRWGNYRRRDGTVVRP
jgi:hypothetical protein